MTADPHDQGFQAAGRIGRQSARGPLLGAGLVTVFLAVAIVKPWARPATPRPSPAPSAAASAPASAELTPAPFPPPSIEPVLFPPTPNGDRSDDQLRSALEVRAAWGMRAIVQSRRGVLAGPNLSERWVAAPVADNVVGLPAADDTVPLDEALTDPADGTYALGVTSPADALTLDIRFWRTSDDRGWVRLLPQPIRGDDPTSWLWRPDPSWSTSGGLWPSGTYRIDVLLADRIVRLEAVIAGSFQADEPAVAPASLRSFADALQELPAGPFGLTPDGPATIPLAIPEDLDEFHAWLADSPGAPAVARLGSREVRGVGIRTSDLGLPDAIQLEQVGVGGIDVVLETFVFDAATGGAVIARPRDGRVLADGLYRITATRASEWLADWEFEVTPNARPPQPPASPLDVLRRWGGLVGQIPVELVTVPDDRGADVVAATCDPSAAFTATYPYFGIRLPEGIRIDRVRLLPIDASRADLIYPRFTATGIDGTAIVALPDWGLPRGNVDVLLDLTDGAGSWLLTQRVCVA